jgi:hypothetical protein
MARRSVLGFVAASCLFISSMFGASLISVNTIRNGGACGILVELSRTGRTIALERVSLDCEFVPEYPYMCIMIA